MNNCFKKTVSSGCGIATLLFALLPADLYARAGGGGGGGGGILGLILYPFLLIYIGILHFKISRKNQEADALIEKISVTDSGWRTESLKHRIEECYFKVQEAWMERNQDLARDYMSRGLYDKHKAQTDLMIKDHEKNILKEINLVQAKIVEAIDYKDNSKDLFWVYIRGSMIDYTVKDNTGEVIKGNPNEAEKFSELWKFIRDDNGRWVLDDIDQEVGLDDLSSFKSKSEQV